MLSGIVLGSCTVFAESCLYVMSGIVLDRCILCWKLSVLSGIVLGSCVLCWKLSVLSGIVLDSCFLFWKLSVLSGIVLGSCRNHEVLQHAARFLSILGENYYVFRSSNPFLYTEGKNTRAYINPIFSYLNSNNNKLCFVCRATFLSWTLIIYKFVLAWKQQIVGTYLPTYLPTYWCKPCWQSKSSVLALK